MNKISLAIAVVFLAGASFLIYKSPVAAPTPISIPVPITPIDITPTPTPTPKNISYLSGHVTIGPICPVERIDNPCKASPEAYTSRAVVVFAGNTLMSELKRVYLDAQGNYKIAISAGSYILQIQPAGIGAGEKKYVTVKAGETTVTDFDIDTGIR